MRSNVSHGGTSALKCPRHYTQFSAPCTISIVQYLKHFNKVLCPWHHKSSLCSMISCSVPLSPLHPLSVSVQTSGTGMKGFLSLSGLISFGENRSWASASQPTSPDVSWAEPLSTWHCLVCTLWWCGALLDYLLYTLWWCSTLLELACWPPCESCMVTYFVKRNHFSYDFVVNHQPADLLFADVVLLPPTIGPTLCASFVSWALCHPLQRGGFSCTGPMAVYRDKSTG